MPAQDTEAPRPPVPCEVGSCSQCGRGSAPAPISLESITVEELLAAWSRFNGRIVAELRRREQLRIDADADADRLLGEILAGSEGDNN